MLYRKARDNEILNFIEMYGGTNIKTIANIYYDNSNNGYILASRRLKLLYDNKFLKRNRKSINDEFIYYRGNNPISLHKAKLLEVYSRIYRLGKINKFTINMDLPCRREIDGFIELEIEDTEYINTYPIIIEIDNTHNTSIKKINDIYNCGYFQKQYGIFPIIVRVKRNEYDKKLYHNDINIYNLEWDLKGINDIIE